MVDNIEIIKEVDDSSTVFIHIPNFLSSEEIAYLKNNLDDVSDWKTGNAFGKEIKRQQKWYNLNNQEIGKDWFKKYDRWKCHEYENWLLKLQNDINFKVNKICEPFYQYNIDKIDINSVLINKYDDHTNSIRPHRDSDKSFGLTPTITSLTIGQERDFVLNRIYYNENNLHQIKNNKTESHLNRIYSLKSGSLFIMAGSSQKYYSHEIPKTTSICDVRYNLTFRHYV
jgi:alkylated DNA repair dioxygenase AlkB